MSRTTHPMYPQPDASLQVPGTLKMSRLVQPGTKAYWPWSQRAEPYMESPGSYWGTFLICVAQFPFKCKGQPSRAPLGEG